MALSCKSSLHARNKGHTKPVLHLRTGKLWCKGGFFFPVENRVCQLTIDFESDFFDVLQLKYTEVGRPLKLQENAYLNASKVCMTCSYSTA